MPWQQFSVGNALGAMQNAVISMTRQTIFTNNLRKAPKISKANTWLRKK